MNDLHSHENGQTVVELIVVSTLLMILTAATLMVLHSITSAEHTQQARSVALDEMRSALARMTRDIRQATSVDAASARGRLVMQTRVSGAAATVVYEVADGVLERTVGSAGTEPLVRRVSATDVFCYDPPTCSAVTPTTEPTVIEVLLSVTPADPRAEPIALTTDVTLRNVRS